MLRQAQLAGAERRGRPAFSLVKGFRAGRGAGVVVAGTAAAGGSNSRLARGRDSQFEGRRRPRRQSARWFFSSSSPPRSTSVCAWRCASLRRRRTVALVPSELHNQSANEFAAARLPEAPSCRVLDGRLPGLSGLGLQQRLRAKGVQTPMIFITGHGDIPMTVTAIEKGAIEFLAKRVLSAPLTLSGVGYAAASSRALASLAVTSFPSLPYSWRSPKTSMRIDCLMPPTLTGEKPLTSRRWATAVPAAASSAA